MSRNGAHWESKQLFTWKASSQPPFQVRHWHDQQDMAASNSATKVQRRTSVAQPVQVKRSPPRQASVTSGQEVPAGGKSSSPPANSARPASAWEPRWPRGLLPFSPRDQHEKQGARNLATFSPRAQHENQGGPGTWLSSCPTMGKVLPPPPRKMERKTVMTFAGAAQSAP